MAAEPEVPARMEAAYIERFGSASEIRYGELPMPVIGPGQVLVRVVALAVNPIDTYIRAGAYRIQAAFPFTIGRDVVGRVVRTGANVTEFMLGRLVWCNNLGYSSQQSSFAEYAAVAQDRLYSLPGGVDPEHAAADFHPAAAFIGLVHHLGGVHPGDVVLVGGDAGNVGSAVVQLAGTMGARLLATTRGAEDIAWCRECGAADAFAYDDPNLPGAVSAAAPRGADVVWNTSGHDDLDLEVELLAPRGCLVRMAGLNQRSALPVGPFYTKNARAVGFTITAATTAQLAEAARAINAMLAAGTLKMRIARVLPLSQAAEAHCLVEGSAPGGKVKGRMVVIPQTDASAR